MTKHRAVARFDRTAACRRLRQLARKPYDLTARGALAAGRIGAMRSAAAGLDLLYATERLTDKVLAALQALADETRAVGQFARMMRGAKMNRIVGHKSENRSVLHTASRNVFPKLACRHDAKQADAVRNAKAQLRRLRRFLAELDGGALGHARGKRFTDLVQVGIGGSDLGPRALYLALPRHRLKGRRVHFLSNVDPDDAAQVLRGLHLATTLVVVVSKSGTTLETLTNESLVRRQFEKRGLAFEKQCIAVTAKGSPMDDPRKYLRVFHMYDYIGGRFSATSMVGGVALGFGLGYDTFIEILRGAREMDLNALEPDIRENLALLAALIGIWNRNFLG